MSDNNIEVNFSKSVSGWGDSWMYAIMKFNIIALEETCFSNDFLLIVEMWIMVINAHITEAISFLNSLNKISKMSSGINCGL